MSFISLKVKDLATPFLQRVGRGAKGVVARAVAEYIIGDSSHGLKHDESYRSVSRKGAYGVTFFSDKQRRGYFAKLKSGEIQVPYLRTGKQADSWHMEGASTNVRIVSNDETVGFTRGQTALHAKMGRRTVPQVVADNIKGAIRHAQAELNKWIGRQ
jgi:glutaredoxin